MSICVTLHADAIHRGGGQIIPTARRVFYAAVLDRNETQPSCPRNEKAQGTQGGSARTRKFPGQDVKIFNCFLLQSLFV